MIYKPNPVFNERNELIAIIGNMFDESSSPAFFKIDKDDIGSCYAIREGIYYYCPFWYPVP